MPTITGGIKMGKGASEEDKRKLFEAVKTVSPLLQQLSKNKESE